MAGMELHRKCHYIVGSQTAGTSPSFPIAPPHVPDLTSPRSHVKSQRPRSRVPTRSSSHVPMRPHVPRPQTRVSATRVPVPVPVPVPASPSHC